MMHHCNQGRCISELNCMGFQGGGGNLDNMNFISVEALKHVEIYIKINSS